jgi:hypothetical protein
MGITIVANRAESGRLTDDAITLSGGSYCNHRHPLLEHLYAVYFTHWNKVRFDYF